MLDILSFGPAKRRRQAAKYIRAGQPIPLDLYAQLLGDGIDLTEFERTIRNG